MKTNFRNFLTMACAVGLVALLAEPVVAARRNAVPPVVVKKTGKALVGAP